MHTKWVFKHFRPQGTRLFSGLAALWTLGILAGIALSVFSADHTGEVFWGAMAVQPSPLTLVLVCLIPIAFTTTAFLPSCAWLSYLSLTIFATFYGFCGMSVFLAVGNAAWLVRPMFLFVTGCTSVLIWRLVIQMHFKKRFHECIKSVLLLISLVVIFDLFFISPFIGDLTNVLLEGFA